MRYSWVGIFRATILAVVSVALVWRIMPGPRLASPEANLRALVNALQKDDQRDVARLSSAEGLSNIQAYIKNSGTSSFAEFGNALAADHTQEMRRHRTTETEVVLVSQDGWYYVFVESDGSWRFNEFYYLVE
jgi:uncharacterized membrane protein YvbJ